MGPFYELVCAESDQTVDRSLLNELKEKNAKKLKEIEAEIVDAEHNLGTSLNTINSLQLTTLIFTTFRRKRGPTSVAQKIRVPVSNRRQDKRVDRLPFHLRKDRRHWLPHRFGIQLDPLGTLLSRPQTDQRQHRQSQRLDGAGR